MPETYQEKVASVGPSVAGFAFDYASSVMPYFVKTENLDAALVDLLGSCERRGDGRLRRVLPKAHPRFPWLYAERVTEVRGLGKPVLTAAEPDLEAPALPFYADYPEYLINVEFKARPYALVQDSLITKEVRSWTKEDGTAVNGAFTTEYTRFTDFEVDPNPELLTFQSGQFKFRTSDNSPPGGVEPPPPGQPRPVTFPGRPRILIPGQKITVVWYMVPYSYLEPEDGPLKKFAGTVNQLEWLDYPAGTLLYVGARAVRRYTPVAPELEFFNELGTFSTSKLCDLALSFQYTGKRATKPPVPPNANWVAEGHNAHAFSKTRKFYYTSAHAPIYDAGGVEIGEDPAGQYPTYPSAPHQLLFTDPDA